MNTSTTTRILGVGPTRSGSHRFVLAQSVRWAVRPTLLVAAIGFYATTGGAIAAWPWVVALAIAGMAHGAYDIAVIRRRAPSLPGRLLVISVYSAIMLAAAAMLWAAPAVSIVLFLMLSAHHFGVSDHPATRGRVGLSPAEQLMGFSYGVLVLCTPFALKPAAAWRPFEDVVAALGGAPVSLPTAQLTGAAAAVSMVLATLTLLTLVRRSSQRLTDVLEQAAVIAAAILLGALTDPLFAVGVYFLVVHAAGHCLRADMPGRPTRVPSLHNAARVHFQSVWWLVPSVAAVGVLALWMHASVAAESLAVAFIAFCIIATAPHHLIWLGFRLPGMSVASADGHQARTTAAAA